MAASQAAAWEESVSAAIRWTRALLTALCILAISSRAQTTDLLAAAVDPGIGATLHGQRAPWALPQNSQGAVPDDTLLEHLTLVLKRSPQRQRVLEQLLQSQQDPSSPNYHRWLTPIQIGQRFGASQHDIEAIAEWLRAQGLRVDSVANSRMMIDFSYIFPADFAAIYDLNSVYGQGIDGSGQQPPLPTETAEP